MNDQPTLDEFMISFGFSKGQRLTHEVTLRAIAKSDIRPIDEPSARFLAN